MILEQPGSPLRPVELPDPTPGDGEVVLRTWTCGVCRTDLHVVDGDLRDGKLPIVPGHEIVGEVIAVGKGVDEIGIGDRLGVPWLASTCGHCRFCTADRENLCTEARFTGYHVDGGFAEQCVVDARYAFPVPDAFSDLEAAPLMCAGLIGFRSYRMCGDAQRVGFFGFGAAAHILVQLAHHEGREVYAFTRPGDLAAKELAMELGASWVGDSTTTPPRPLDAAIIFAPVGDLVPIALGAVDQGGTVVCAGIHMSDIPSFEYARLWRERVVRSVANLTRDDGMEFFARIRSAPIRTVVHPYPLEKANDALDDLRHGRFTGAAVLTVTPPPPPPVS